MSDYQLSFEKRARYVFIKGTGVRKNLTAIVESSHEFSRIIEETKPRYVLVDYSELTTIISNHDVFNITRMYESGGAELQKLTISIIINPDELEVEKFWEEICRKRGFDFKIFTQALEAEAWLLEQINGPLGWQIRKP